MLRFTLLGCLLGLSIEFQFKTLAFWNPRGLAIACVAYPLIISQFYLFGAFFDRVAGPRLTDLAHYAFVGCAGLAVEWMILGNAPGKQAGVSQVGMWCMWTAFGWGPRILLRRDPDTARLRRTTWGIYAAFVVVSLVLAVVVPKPGARAVLLIYTAIVAYTAMNLPLLWASWRTPRATIRAEIGD